MIKLTYFVRLGRDALNARKLAAPHVESSYAAEGRALREREMLRIRHSIRLRRIRDAARHFNPFGILVDKHVSW